jgi:hypothetical protein
MKTVTIACALFLSGLVLGQLVIVPDKYISMTPRFANYCMPFVSDPIFTIDFKSLAAALPSQVNASTFFQSDFTLSVNTVNIKITPSTISYLSQTFNILPNTQAYFQRLVYDNSGTLTFRMSGVAGKWAPLFGFNTSVSLDITSNKLGVRLRATFNFDIMSQTYGNSVVSFIQKQALTSSCVNIRFNTGCTWIEPTTQIVITADIYNRMEDAAYQVGLFDLVNFPSIIYNGIAISSSNINLSGQTLTISNLPSAILTATGVNLIRICNTRTPLASQPIYLQMEHIAYGNSYVSGLFLLQSMYNFSLLAGPVVQASTAINAPFNLKFKINAEVNFKFNQSITFRVVLPSSIYSNVSQISFKATSIINGVTSQRLAALKTSGTASSFDISFERALFSMTEGVNLEIFGFSNGNIEGSYSLTTQILNSNLEYSTAVAIPFVLVK